MTCGHCKAELSGHSYKKPLLSVTTALIVGAGGFYATDKFVLSEDRYPLKTEYAILSSCANSFDKPISRSSYNKKNDVCICALEKTMDEFSYSDLKSDEKGFLEKFRLNSETCV